MWEYLIYEELFKVSDAWYGPPAGAIVSSRSAVNTPKGEIIDVLAELGGAGWELCTVSNVPAPNNSGSRMTYYYFKRPIK